MKYELVVETGYHTGSSCPLLRYDAVSGALIRFVQENPFLFLFLELMKMKYQYVA